MPPRRTSMVLRATKKVVKETVQIAVVQSEAGKQSQESEQETVKSIPVEEQHEDDNVTFEVPIQEPEPEPEPEPSIEQQKVEAPTQEPEPSNEEPSSSDLKVAEEPPEKGEKEKEKAQENKECERSSSLTLEKSEEPQEKEETATAKKRKTQEEKRDDKREKKKRRRTRRKLDSGDQVSNYKRYVFKVLKHVHPGLAISSKAIAVINGLMNDMYERVAEEASKLSKYTDRRTLSSREIQGAVKLVLPGELSKHAIAEGNKAVNNYVSYKK